MLNHTSQRLQKKLQSADRCKFQHKITKFTNYISNMLRIVCAMAMKSKE